MGVGNSLEDIIRYDTHSSIYNNISTAYVVVRTGTDPTTDTEYSADLSTSFSGKEVIMSAKLTYTTISANSLDDGNHYIVYARFYDANSVIVYEQDYTSSPILIEAGSNYDYILTTNLRLYDTLDA